MVEWQLTSGPKQVTGTLALRQFAAANSHAGD
jgi:hypothetical protein